MRRFIALLFAITLSLAATKRPAITLDITPVFSFAPNRSVRVHIEPDERNDYYCVGWVWLGSAAMNLYPTTDAPRTWARIPFPIASQSCRYINQGDLPTSFYEWGNNGLLPGDYTAFAFLVRYDKTVIKSMERNFKVVE